METILYNLDTGAIHSRHQGGYMVNGKPVPSSVLVRDRLVELEVDDVALPPSPYHKEYWEADIENEKYRKKWRLWSEYELAMQNWHYPKWAMRIAIPLNWFDPAFTGISEETKAVIEKFWVWWNAMEFPTKRVGDVRYGYCNVIQPHHQQFLENLGIVPENRPEMSDY